MSRRLRVLVALATVAAMLLSLAGFASAQFEDVDKDAAYADDVEFLYELGITTGISATEFGPDQPLTRQQFAVFVIRAQKQSALADSFANWRTNFTDDADIAPWARGAVYLASSSGIINGYPDGSFKPNNPVTVAEALTMLVRALGFKTYAESKGGFPAGYLIVAQELGLDDGLTLTAANLPMKRWEMAVALVNALHATRAKNEDGSPDFSASDPQSWLTALWDEDPEFTYEGKVSAIRQSSSRIVVGSRTFKYDKDTEVLVNGVPQGTVAKAIDDELIKKDQLVKVTYDPKDDDIALAIDVLVDTYENALLRNVRTDKDETDFGSIVVQARGDSTSSQTVKVDDETVILLNGRKATLADLEEAFDDFQDEWGKSPAVATVRVEGKAAVDEVENNDRAVYVSVITDDVVEGEIERTGRDRNGDYVVIDGKRYNLGDDYRGNVPGTGRNVALLLGHDGKAYVVLRSATVADSYYAILVDYVRGSNEHAVLELADGSEVTFYKDDFDQGHWTIDPDVAGMPVYYDGSGEKAKLEPVDVTKAKKNKHEGTVDRVTSRSIRIRNNGGTSTYVFAESVLVYDLDNDEYVDVDDIEEGDTVRLYEDHEGDVGLVVIYKPSTGND